MGGVVVSQTSGPPNTETAHQVHRSASGARAARGLDPEEGRDGLDGLEGTACAGSRRQAGRDRRGTRVQPSHGVQTEQAAISPDRRGGLVCFYGWTHGKSSAVGTWEIKAMGNSKEPLPCGIFDQGRALPRPAGDGIDGESGESERIGAAIPDILRGLWAAQPL